MGCDRKTWPQSTSLLKNEKQKTIETNPTCSMGYFQKQRIRNTNLSIFWLFVCYFYFCYSHYDNLGSWNRPQWLQASHHGRGAAVPLKKCDILQSSQRHLLITFTLWKWSRVQVRAVEEETVKKGNAAERYLFLSPRGK